MYKMFLTSQSQLEDTYRKQLEYEFHSAGYHAIMEVVTGLRTVMGHLIKEVSLAPIKTPGIYWSILAWNPGSEEK